jgi:hypothetical protein
MLNPASSAVGALQARPDLLGVLGSIGQNNYYYVMHALGR